MEVKRGDLAVAVVAVVVVKERVDRVWGAVGVILWWREGRQGRGRWVVAELCVLDTYSDTAAERRLHQAVLSVS